MQGSTTGPDMIDVRTYLTSLDALFGTSTKIEMQAVGKPMENGWLVTITSVRLGCLPPQEGEAVVSKKEYYGGTSLQLGYALHELLYKHDHAMMKAWASEVPMKV